MTNRFFSALGLLLPHFCPTCTRRTVAEDLVTGLRKRVQCELHTGEHLFFRSRCPVILLWQPEHDNARIADRVVVILRTQIP